jgi:hypothetical protein
VTINSFGFDINQQGASQYPRTSYEVPQAYFTGIVEDIILNEKNGKILKYEADGSNIGKILVRILPDDENVPLENLKPAYPLEANIQSYPLLGEQVIVYKSLNALFYSRSVASTRKVSQNEWKSLRRRFSKIDASLNTEERELARTGTPLTDVFNDMRSNATDSVGNEYNSNNRAKMVRSSEGDVIVHGRFGNVIRMGSSLFKEPTQIPQPSILLTAGLWETPAEVSTGGRTRHSLAYENLDNDASSIWMVSDQTVEFTAATQLSSSTPKAHLMSTPRKTSRYDGAQIFINSDRVVLNSKKNEVSIFSNREINLSALGAISLDTENTIFLNSFADITMKANNAISLTASDISLTATNSLSYEVNGDYIMKGSRVFIGRYGLNMEPMVLGRSLAYFLQSLVEQLQQTNEVLDEAMNILATSTTPLPGTTPPVTRIVQPKLKLETSGIKLNSLRSDSNPTNANFNSKDNFIAQTNT